MWSQSCFEWISLKANASSMEWIIVKPHSFPACVYPKRDEIQSCPDLFAVCGIVYREVDALISNWEKPYLSTCSNTYRNSSWKTSWLLYKKLMDGNKQLSIQDLTFRMSKIKEYKQRIVMDYCLPKFENISPEWFDQRYRAVASFPRSAYSFLPSNLSSPCLAYGSHRLACLNYVGRYCVGGRERKGVMFTVPTRGIRPWRCFTIKRGGGDERCQCPLSDWRSSSLNSRRRETEKGRKWNSLAILCCGFS